MTAKKKSNFFDSFWQAMGNYAGVKAATIAFAILFGGGFIIKSCNDPTITPPTHGGVTVRNK
ncbi:MAG: hypothetical protein HY841_15245 [Bacteroidetes bacterium]|nr:hypothetical protein [Bacteroidota bacterium]